MKLEEARKKCLPGWNLRCNLCGEHPASWIPNARPGWGSLALCDKHREYYESELNRHRLELKRLRKINYEQLPGNLWNKEHDE